MDATAELPPGLQLTADALTVRRDWFEVRDEDLHRLLSLHAFAETQLPAVVGALDDALLSHPKSREFLVEPKRVAALRVHQLRYFLGLFDGRCDLAYVEERLRVGVVHHRLGLPIWLYLGAFRRFLELFSVVLHKELPAAEADAALESVRRLSFLDMALALDAYAALEADAIRAAQEALIGRHRAAVEELSTPVIRVFEGVLLLPLIGAIDSARAQGIMEAVLKRVSEQEARVMIIDIAGVAIVDTQVADHLLRAYAAVRLLGAVTILTGISPNVARTMVDLGVDISAMHTRSRLADGITLALSLLGRSVTDGAGG